MEERRKTKRRDHSLCLHSVISFVFFLVFLDIGAIIRTPLGVQWSLTHKFIINFNISLGM